MTNLRLQDKRAIITGSGIGRAGLPEEVAAIMAFLASDDATYLSGAVWAADGDMTVV